MGPLVGIAQLAGFEADAVDCEREAIEPAGAGNVWDDSHTLRLQALHKLQHGLRAGGQGGVQDALQLHARRERPHPLRGLDLAFLWSAAGGSNEAAVLLVRGTGGDGEVMDALQALDGSGAP
ncbi:hypothetical protein [Thiomonas intermedia]|uniref:hypothetical protein n=1 Tax=Thiomonas intermedia TaxID=926 RepID=UPI0014740DBF|nr:hypothetical protein [Thiomonas intermedia]